MMGALDQLLVEMACAWSEGSLPQGQPQPRLPRRRSSLEEPRNPIRQLSATKQTLNLNSMHVEPEECTICNYHKIDETVAKYFEYFKALPASEQKKRVICAHFIRRSDKDPLEFASIPKIIGLRTCVDCTKKITLCHLDRTPLKA